MHTYCTCIHTVHALIKILHAAQEWETTCLMNYTPQEAAEFQDPALEALAYKERNIIMGLHERCVQVVGGGGVCKW